VTRHHAHAGDHLVMVLAGAAAIAFGVACWAGLAWMFGGVS
jgi:hypothetical protein